eukprot:scaffold49092_cov37-Attheya_sp.AAC.2
MEGMFYQDIVFNQDVSSWDVSNVIYMGNVFYSDYAFNQDLSSWNVSSVIDMGYLFNDAWAFNQDISSWEVSSVTDMNKMFKYASSFNQNLCDWVVKTPSLMNVSRMFESTNCPNSATPQLASPGGTPGPFCHDCMTECRRRHVCTVSSGNQGIPINDERGSFKTVIVSYLCSGSSSYGKKNSCWDVSEVIDMSFAFSELKDFIDPLCWNGSNVMNMERMFYSASAFDQDVSSWDVLSVTNMDNMFLDATAFNQEISSWDVLSVTSMQGMFVAAKASNQEISSWDVSKVTSMAAMLYGATAFNHDLSSWNVLNVTTMLYYMFFHTAGFNQDLCDWAVKTPSLSIVDETFALTACPNHTAPMLASPGGTIDDIPHLGPFCHACTPLNSSRGLSVLK